MPRKIATHNIVISFSTSYPALPCTLDLRKNVQVRTLYGASRSDVNQHLSLYECCACENERTSGDTHQLAMASLYCI